MRKYITMAEVKQHNKPDDAWMVLGNKVYNITPYLHYHPGGADILQRSAGRDATLLFQKYHPWVNAHGLVGACFLGMLDSVAGKPGAGAGAGGGAASEPAAG